MEFIDENWALLKNWIMGECSYLRRQLVRLYLWITFLFAIISPVIIVFFFLSNLFTIFIYCYGLMVLIFMVFFIKKLGKFSKITRELIINTPQNSKNQEYHAIIIAHSKRPNDKGLYPEVDYGEGIDILINFFISQPPPIPFEVKEVTTKKETIAEICNPKAQYLWIFGHGQRNILGLQDGALCYKELPSSLQKKFVGQYHCNSPFGTSLAEHTNAQESDVTCFFRFAPFTRIAIRRKLRDLKEKKMI